MDDYYFRSFSEGYELFIARRRTNDPGTPRNYLRFVDALADLLEIENQIPTRDLLGLNLSGLRDNVESVLVQRIIDLIIRTRTAEKRTLETAGNGVI